METKKKTAKPTAKKGNKKPVKSVDDFKSIHGHTNPGEKWGWFKG